MDISQDTQRRYLILLSILAAFITNILANITPLNGLTIAEISDKYFSSVLIVPSSYAFSIWGVIYLGLIALGIYQVLPNQRQNQQTKILGTELIWSSVTQIIWVGLFQYELFIASLIAIILILLPLIRLYMRLYSDQTAIAKRVKLLTKTPVSIYCAWLTVATIVNTACTLDFMGWQGFGLSPAIWTSFLLVIGLGLAGFVSLKYKDVAFSGVFIWAWVAIAIKNSAQTLIPMVAIITAIFLLLICLKISFWPQLKS